MEELYLNRIIDQKIEKTLRSMGAILIEGTKWCGKSTTAFHHCKSAIFMDDPSKTSQYLLFAQENPSMILDGETPRLIDEWQIAPQLWDAVRYTVDHRKGKGQFILTGSAKPADRSKIHHSGTGRFAWIRMRTMSLFESGDSTGEVSLGRIFDNPEEKIACEAPNNLNRIAFLICRGGWPAAIGIDEDVAFVPAEEYYNAVVNIDISRVDGVERSVERAKLLMRSYARSQGSHTAAAKIAQDVNGVDQHNNTIDDKTVRSYIDALKSLFVIEDMPAWNPNLKSKTAIRSADTRYFSDPSIATASLGIGPGDLMDNMLDFGFFFETLCVRDLRVYAQSLGGEVYHYRDKTGLECDVVIHLHDGRYGLVEIKLGGEERIEEGAANLKKLASKIDTDKMRAPSFMMIVTAMGAFAYRRQDGILIIPITTLRN